MAISGVLINSCMVGQTFLSDTFDSEKFLSPQENLFKLVHYQPAGFLQAGGKISEITTRGN